MSSSAPVSGSAPTRVRRTQAQRRAATRTALLDACLDALLARGYARLTTADVVRRAGVSRGAQAHHFGTKAELVVAALRHLVDRLVAEVAARPADPVVDPARARRELLELLWTVHSDRAFPALMELWVAARADEELRATLAEFDRDLTRQVVGYCQRRLPELAGQPDSGAMLATVLAALRGLALIECVGSDGEPARLWPGVRTELLALLELRDPARAGTQAPRPAGGSLG